MERIKKINPDDLSSEAREIFDRWSPGGKPLNIVLIYFRNQELNRTWSYMATHLFFKTSLTPREREIIVLRTSWQCKSDYEFIQHIRIAREEKLLSEEEISDLLKADCELDWDETEKLLINLSDSLLSSHGVDDRLWSELIRAYSYPIIADAVMTVGGYTLNSMATNSYHVDIEDNMEKEAGLTPSMDEGAVVFKPRINISLNHNKVRLPDSFEHRAIDTGQDLAPSQSDKINLLQAYSLHPKMFKSWAKVLNYNYSENQLSNKIRFAIALRTAAASYCGYELAHMKAQARKSGLASDQIDTLGSLSSLDTVVDLELKLVTASVDELMQSYVISDELWVKLQGIFSDEQIMDIVFQCAVCLMNCWYQNVFGLVPDDIKEVA